MLGSWTAVGEGRWGWLQWEKPYVGGGAARSFEEKFVVSEDAAAVLGELYVTSVVAEFCDGEKGVGRQAR
jgi:hypothetical protein